MSSPPKHAARSAAAFGTYLVALGAGITYAPHAMRDLFNSILVSGKLPPVGAGEQSLWLRAFGIVTAYVGLYYLQAARYNLLPIFELTVIAPSILKHAPTPLSSSAIESRRNRCQGYFSDHVEM